MRPSELETLTPIPSPVKGVPPRNPLAWLRARVAQAVVADLNDALEQLDQDSPADLAEVAAPTRKPLPHWAAGPAWQRRRGKPRGTSGTGPGPEVASARSALSPPGPQGTPGA